MIKMEENNKDDNILERTPIVDNNDIIIEPKIILQGKCHICNQPFTGDVVIRSSYGDSLTLSCKVCYVKKFGDIQ